MLRSQDTPLNLALSVTAVKTILWQRLYGKHIKETKLVKLTSRVT